MQCSQYRHNPLTGGETGKKIKNYLYQYGDQIGNGNFARVFKGINITNQETVAIKMISLDQLKSKHLEELVFAEIKILQLMRHPNILSFKEALLSERNCYIVTELCTEGSLDDRIKTRVPLSQREIANVIIDLWKGLKYLREKGVVHRDLKPANIFMDHGRAIIADFGLAKFYQERFKDLDIGSPHYMSPEGVISHCYSQKTDIWALGITIYQILHGCTPFAFCKTDAQLRYYVQHRIPQDKWRKDINPLLRQFINKCLEIDEFKRPNIFQLATEPYLAQLLQHHVGEIVINHQPNNNVWNNCKQDFLSIYPKNEPNPWKNTRPHSSSGSPIKVNRVHPIAQKPEQFDFAKPQINYPRPQNENIPGGKQEGQRLYLHSSFSKKDRQKVVIPQYFDDHAIVRNPIPPQSETQSNNPRLSLRQLPGSPRRIPNFPHQLNNHSHSPYLIAVNGSSPEHHGHQICSRTSETNSSEEDRRASFNQAMKNGRQY